MFTIYWLERISYARDETLVGVARIIFELWQQQHRW